MLATIILVLCFLAGIFLNKVIPNFKAPRNYINKYLIYIGLPLLVFVSFSKVKNIPLLKYFIFSAVFTLIIIFIMYFIARAFKLGSKEKASLFLCSAFGNTAYLGIPFLFLLFGGLGSTIASIVTIVTFFLHLTLGVYLANTFVEKKQAFKKILKQPFFWVLLIIILLSRFELTIPSWLDSFAGSGTYIAVFVIGGSLIFSYINMKNLVYSLLKLLLAPLIVLPLIFLFKIQDIWPFLLLAATPSAFLNTSLALEFKLDERLASGLTAIGTIIFIMAFLIIQQIIAVL